MKVVSIKSEIKAIFTICNTEDDKIQSKLMSKLTKHHFGYSPCKNIYERILTLLREDKSIPNTALFAEDLGLDDESKNILKSTKYEVVGKKSVDPLIKTLDRYRKYRVVYNSLANLSEQLKGDKPKHIDSLVEEHIDYLAKMRSIDDVHFSTNLNFNENIERILNGKFSIVPSGFAPWDKENGGFINGQVIVIAANSGGGKSLVTNQMMLNQYKLGFSPLKVTFEMEEDEEWQRVLSNITGINHNKFIKKSLSEKEKKKVWKISKKFRDHGKKKNCKITFIHLSTGTKFSEVSYIVKHKKCDIIYLDYISLLGAEDPSKPTHEQLGQITKMAKRLAEDIQKPVVILAQLNKDEDIKYSGAIREDAGVVWQWVRDEQAVSTKEIMVNCTKARNQTPLDFILKENFEVMKAKAIDANGGGDTEEQEDTKERIVDSNVSMSGLDDEDL